MSDEGRDYVKRFSPFTGQTFWLHYVFGDIANAQHNYELYVGDGKLMTEWPFSRRAIVRGRTELTEAGFITPIGRSAPGHLVRYRFEFLKVEPNTRQIGARSTDAKTDTNRRQKRQQRAPKPKTSPLTNRSETEIELAAPNGCGPLSAKAQELTVLAMEQPTKPAGANAFPKALTIIKAILEAGHPADSVESAIRTGVGVWSIGGFEMALQKCGRQHSSRNVNTIDATLAQMPELAAQ